MKRLKFTVENQRITRVDDAQPVAGSRNYLYADFEFLTEEWNVPVKTAIFESNDQAYKVLIVNNSCEVPWETIMESGWVNVSVFCGDLVTANVAKVYVAPTGYREDAENERQPTTEIYEQIINLINSLIGNVDGGFFTDWSDE